MQNNGKMKSTSLFWSDNWWIEDGEAWFVGGDYTAIFRVNLYTKECCYIAEIPEKIPYAFRKYPRCVLCEKDLYCLPDIGNRIWIYHVDSQQFFEIPLDIPNEVRVGIYGFWKWKDSLFLYSNGLQRLIEVDLKNRSIKWMTAITDEKDKKVVSLIRIDSSLWGVSPDSNKVYEYQLDTGVKRRFALSEVQGSLRTICHDGKCFWLSGDRREIYIWNPHNGETKILDHLPDSFGIYNFGEPIEKFLDCKKMQYETPAFLYSVCVNDTVWFIPFLTNHILYGDKNTHEIKELWIDGEDDEYGCIDKRRMQAKYCLEYVQDEFIGVYSYKNGIMYRIDTNKKEVVEDKYYLIDTECIPLDGRTVHEIDGLSLSLLLQSKLKEKRENAMKSGISVGEQIYRKSK